MTGAQVPNKWPISLCSKERLPHDVLGILHNSFVHRDSPLPGRGCRMKHHWLCPLRLLSAVVAVRAWHVRVHVGPGKSLRCQVQDLNFVVCVPQRGFRGLGTPQWCAKCAVCGERKPQLSSDSQTGPRLEELRHSCSGCQQIRQQDCTIRGRGG